MKTEIQPSISLPEINEATLVSLQILRTPFPVNQISKLAKGTKAQNDCPKEQKRRCQVCGGFHHPDIIHLDYVGHAALTDRLLDADPFWYWEPLAFTDDGLPRFDESGGLWIKLTVAGVTRLGYGHAEKKSFQDIGAREKEVIGDALRNAAMRFGAALDLWHKGDLHAHQENNGVFDNLEAPKGQQQEQQHSPADNGVADVAAAIKAATSGNQQAAAPASSGALEPVLTPTQFKTMNKALDDSGSDKAAFCAYFGIASVAALPQTKFKVALEMVNEKIKRNKERTQGGQS